MFCLDTFALAQDQSDTTLSRAFLISNVYERGCSARVKPGYSTDENTIAIKARLIDFTRSTFSRCDKVS